MDWNLIIAGFINSVLVLIIVQVIKLQIPWLRANIPWILPVLAGAIGLIVAPLQTWLGNLLGVPIDLSPLLGIFTGATAVAIHQTSHQIGKGT